MSTIAPKWKAFALLLLLALGLDQGTKIWARLALRPRHPPLIEVISGYFDLSYVENPGAAFSMLREHPGAARPIFVAVGLAFLVVIAISLSRTDPGQRRLAGTLGLLTGGVLGNLLDRIFLGRVTDFIVWRIGDHRWPTFNIADAALLLAGAALLLETRPQRKPARATQ
jgi:signal peptidase II